MSLHCALAGIPGGGGVSREWLTYLPEKCSCGWSTSIANLLLGEAMYPEFIQGAGDAGGARGRVARLHGGGGATRTDRGQAGFVGAAGAAVGWRGGGLPARHRCGRERELA